MAKLRNVTWKQVTANSNPVSDLRGTKLETYAMLKCYGARGDENLEGFTARANGKSICVHISYCRTSAECIHDSGKVESMCRPRGRSRGGAFAFAFDHKIDSIIQSNLIVPVYRPVCIPEASYE